MRGGSEERDRPLFCARGVVAFAVFDFKQRAVDI